MYQKCHLAIIIVIFIVAGVQYFCSVDRPLQCFLMNCLIRYIFPVGSLTPNSTYNDKHRSKAHNKELTYSFKICDHVHRHLCYITHLRWSMLISSPSNHNFVSKEFDMGMLSFVVSMHLVVGGGQSVQS